MNLLAFAFPATVGPYLPTSGGWKAELAELASCIDDLAISYRPTENTAVSTLSWQTIRSRKCSVLSGVKTDAQKH